MTMPPFEDYAPRHGLWMGVDDAFFIMFRAQLTTAEPGQNIGVLLRNGPPREALRGQVVQFETDGTATMGPQFSVLEPKKKRWSR